MVDISIINAWIIYHTNYPDDIKIRSQIDFRLKLIEELVQPLLDLKASPSWPPHLRGSGRKTKYSSEVRLNGKHFPPSILKERDVLCATSSKGKSKDKKTQNYCEKCDTFVLWKMFRVIPYVFKLLIIILTLLNSHLCTLINC